MLIKPLVKGFKVDLWTKIAVFTAIFVYLSVISLTLVFPELDFRLILLIVGLVFLGMPHGAMDIYLASQIIKSKLQLINFVLIYIALSFLVLASWSFSATFSFIVFICYSMFHFADSDIQKDIFKNRLNFLEFSARLPLPFCLPLIFNTEETLRLIEYIHPQINLTSYLLFFQVFGYLGIILTVIYVTISFVNLFRNFKDNDLTFLEPAVLCVLFTQISPLYALGIYFCFIHAIKHIINILKKIEIKSAASILPYWIIPLLGLPVLFWIYIKTENYSSMKFQADIFQYIIITLSALAFPHAVLIRYCKNLKIID